MIADMASILFPLVACILVGMGWAKRNPGLSTAPLSQLLTKVGIPSLMFATLMGNDLELSQLKPMALALLGIFALTGGLAWLVTKICRAPWRIYVPGVMFANTGNMGLPLCFFAFGNLGLSYAMLWYAMVSITHYTLGDRIIGSGAKGGKLWLNPIVWSLSVVALLNLLALPAPEWLLNSTQLIGQIVPALMLILLGASLARMPSKISIRPLVFAVLRVVGGFAAAVLLVNLLNIEGVLRGVIIVQASTASGVVNWLLAERYSRQPEDMAALVLTSTLLAFLLLPFILAWLL